MYGYKPVCDCGLGLWNLPRRNGENLQEAHTSGREDASGVAKPGVRCKPGATDNGGTITKSREMWQKAAGHGERYVSSLESHAESEHCQQPAMVDRYQTTTHENNASEDDSSNFKSSALILITPAAGFGISSSYRRPAFVSSCCIHPLEQLTS